MKYAVLISWLFNVGIIIHYIWWSQGEIKRLREVISRLEDDAAKLEDSTTTNPDKK